MIAATALAAVPAMASPVRAASALPTSPILDAGAAKRAATPAKNGSELIGFPIAAFLGLFAGVVVIAVVASGGGGRSPG
jgi:hypothetical protein